MEIGGVEIIWRTQIAFDLDRRQLEPVWIGALRRVGVDESIVCGFEYSGQ